MTRSVSTRLMLDISGFVAPLKTAAVEARAFTNEFNKAVTKNSQGFQQMSRGATIAGAGILAGFGAAAKVTMDFDKEISAVGAAAGVSGKQLEIMRNAALKAGADTSFSASQAAKAEEELAKAGVSVRDVLGGGLKGALALAAAGNVGLADAAEISASAMTQFALKGKDVPHIADLLSAAANKAQGGVGDMGFALKATGTTAHLFGANIEETTGFLAAMASAGITGENAGTALKQMFLALAAPTDKQAELMHKLNLNMYDSKGQFVGLANFSGQLRSSLERLTPAQRNSAMATIFGAHAIQAANVAYQNGKAGIDGWNKKVNDAGNATRTAAAKMDNLAGDIERLKGSFEVGLIQTGSQGTVVLRVLTKTGENMINSFVRAPAAIRGTVSVIGLVAGVALTAGGAFGMLAPKIRMARAELEAMGPVGVRTNAALGLTTRWAGRAVAAFAAFQVIDTVATQFDRAVPDVDRLTSALRHYADTGKVTGEMARVFQGDTKKLKDALEIQRSALEHPVAANVGGFLTKITFIDHLSNSNKKLLDGLHAQDAALAGMVSSGHGDQAANVVKKMGVAASETAGLLPQYSNALGKAKDETADAAKSMAVAGGQARVMASGMASAIKEAGTLKDVLSGLNDVNISAAEAGIKWRQSLAALRGEIRGNKGSIDGMNQSVIDQIKLGNSALSAQHAQTLAANGGADSARAVAIANGQATASHAQMRNAMIRSAVAAGMHRVAVTALIDSLFKIPSNRATIITVPGATTATASVADLKRKISDLRDKKTVVTQEGAQLAAHQIWLLEQQIQRMTNKNVDIGVQMHGFSADSASHWLAGARAKGGPVQANRPYLVGENGPEIHVPAANGTIIPNDRVVVHFSPSGEDQTHSALSRYAAGLAGTVNRAEAAADVGNVNLGGGSGSSIAAIMAVARRIYPGAVMTSGFRPGANDYHGRGLAADIIGGGVTGMNQIAAGFYAMSNRLLELIHSPRYFVKNGNRVGAEFYRSVYAQHFNHVHVAANKDALSRRTGGVDAHTVSSPTVLYGERETGGEAFVPRKGDPARSKSILDTAAGWYGYGLHKMALGGVIGNSVDWGQVTPYVWNKLVEAGWRGRAGDNAERLYGTWVQLKKAGWQDDPSTKQHMLMPPGTLHANWARGVASAAGELLTHLERGGAIYSNLTYARASANLNKYNDYLLASFKSRRGNIRDRAQLERFLGSYAHPGSAAAKPTAALEARDVTQAPSGPTFSNTGSSISISFTGPVGSRMELQNWVTAFVNDLKRTNRI